MEKIIRINQNNPIIGYLSSQPFLIFKTIGSLRKCVHLGKCAVHIRVHLHQESWLVFSALFRKHKHSCFCVQEVVSGLRQPVGAVHSGDGSHRLFILEKEGYVKILTPEGELFKEPYLDIHKLVQSGIKVGFFYFFILFRLCRSYLKCFLLHWRFIFAIK